MPTYRRDPSRDAWDRQPGETAEHFDWFTAWRNDSHRRSYPRVAEKFGTTKAKVQGAAKRNDWANRLAEWRASESDLIHKRFVEIAEAGLIPFTQAFVRLSAAAVSQPLAKMPPDRALLAATGALKVLKEPDVKGLIQIAQAGGRGDREFDALDVVLDALASQFPDAHEAVLDALANVVDGDEEPTEGGDD